MHKYSLRRLWGVIISCMVVIMIGDYNKAFGCLEDEKIALLKIQDAINHVHTIIQWGTAGKEVEDCCRWEGVTCDPISKRIISLSLNPSGRYINTSLDASLLQPFEELQKFIFDCGSQDFKGPLRLPKLQVLDLTVCNLISLGELPSLKFLYLSGTGVVDDFKELTNLSSLQLLYLDEVNDDLEGRIPPSIFALTSLKMLGLSNNNLNGSLPEEFCTLTNLEELDLIYNAFEGVIPACLSNLTSLRLLDLSHNSFSGNIPSNLFYSLKSLEHVSLSYNDFDGHFSFSSFANNSKLTGFELESNNPMLKVETENGQWLPSFFQLKILRLSNCILNEPTGVIPSFLLSQYELRVVRLSNNGMTGELPSWLITNNSKLEYLSLRNNRFSGQLMLQPDAYHAYMAWLDLSMNQVEGEIPSFIGSNLPNLVYMDMSTNAIDSSIPTSIENMVKLKLLDLSNNHLYEDFIGNYFNGCKELEILKLSNNNFGGNLTNFLSNMLQLPGLLALYLDNNNFYGNLQTIRHRNTSLMAFLDISNNSITGRFPDWIAQLSSLKTLDLSKNHFEGKLPTGFCKLKNIQVLDLSWNNFSDTLPPCTNLSKLNILCLQSNWFHGPLPTSLSRSLSVVTIDVSDNNFSGLIPSWIGLIPKLKFLLLKGNHFHGSIPSEICQIENLRYLDFSANNLSGSIPPCFSHMSFAKTKVIDFQEIHIDLANQGILVEGVLSTLLYSYESQLQRGNIFSEYYGVSTVPEELQFITKSVYGSYRGDILYFMAGIDLSLNRLTGPMRIGNWDNVRSLNFSHNHFNGSIPETLLVLINLESLDVSYNMLTGKIPSEITELSFVEVFSVAYNNLSGPTPTTTHGQFATFDARSYEGNPLLCGLPLNTSCSGGPMKMPQTKLFAEPEQNDSFYKTTFLCSFFGSFVVSCIGAFVFIYFGTNIPQRFLVGIRVEERVSYRTTVELPWK